MNNNINHIDDALLMMFICGEANNEQIKKVESWLNESAENQTYFDQLHEVWLKSDELSLQPIDVNVDNAWDVVSRKIDQLEEDSTPTKKVNFPRTLMSIAASILVILGSIWIYNSTKNPAGPITLASNNIVLNETLSDGSIITLNKNSKITYPEEFDQNARKVSLDGEAFFDIEPKTDQSFTIDAGNSFIKVMGTSFNVKAYKDSSQVEVSVIEGLVQFYTFSNELDTIAVLLSVNETGIYDRENKTIEKLNQVDNNSLYWLNKTLVFEKTRLSEVFKLLESTFNINITVEEETINDYLLSATFKDNEAEEIMMIIAATFNLSFNKDIQNYTIRTNANEE